MHRPCQHADRDESAMRVEATQGKAPTVKQRHAAVCPGVTLMREWDAWQLLPRPCSTLRQHLQLPAIAQRASRPDANGGVDGLTSRGAQLVAQTRVGDAHQDHVQHGQRHVPFMLHIGPGTKTQPKAFRNNGRERAPDLHGGGENLRFCDYMMLWYAPQTFLTAMVYDGVFMRFPRLRGGVIESGAGWVPDFLRQLDLANKSFGRTDPYLKQLDMTPSEYIRRAVKFTPFPGEDVGHMIGDAGADLFLFSSDYPHPEGTKDPFGRFERSMEGIDEVAKDKFYRLNYEQMMGF